VASPPTGRMPPRWWPRPSGRRRGTRWPDRKRPASGRQGEL